MAAGLVAIVALAAMAAMSTAETRARSDAHGPAAIHESVVATLTARPTSHIQVAGAQRSGVAGTLPSEPALLVLAFAGSIVAGTVPLHPTTRRVDIRRRAPPSRFV